MDTHPCKTCARPATYIGHHRGNHETALEFKCVDNGVSGTDCNREGRTFIWMPDEEANAIIYAE